METTNLFKRSLIFMFTGNKDSKFVCSLGMASASMRSGKSNDEIIKMLENRGHTDEEIMEILGIIAGNQAE